MSYVPHSLNPLDNLWSLVVKPHWPAEVVGVEFDRLGRGVRQWGEKFGVTFHL